MSAICLRNLFRETENLKQQLDFKMRDVGGYLTTQIEATGNNEGLCSLWRKAKDYYQRRLWHQLTGILLDLVKREELQKGDDLWQLYTNVIADFEIK